MLSGGPVDVQRSGILLTSSVHTARSVGNSKRQGSVEGSFGSESPFFDWVAPDTEYQKEEN